MNIKLAILILEALDLLIERSISCSTPKIPHSSRFVIVLPTVVKTMSDFMTYYSSNASIIKSTNFSVEENRIQDAHREDDSIVRSIVEGVDFQRGVLPSDPKNKIRTWQLIIIFKKRRS